MPRTPPASLPLVLVAGEKETSARWLEDILVPREFAVLQTANGRQALVRARGTNPDVIVVDAVLPDMSGLELCRLLRDDPRIATSTPIVVTTPHVATPEQRVAALRAGAWECINRSVDPDEVALKLAAYLRAKLDADRARAEGLVDLTTGLYNRQGMARRARELGAEAFRRHGALACVAFAVDVQPGPSSTETLGATLRRSVQALKTTGRLSDVLGRLGPTEFAVLAPATDAAGAERLAERMLSTLRGTDVPALQVRVGIDAVANVGYAPLEAVDLLVHASTALRRGTTVGDSFWIRRYDAAVDGLPGSAPPSPS